MASFSAKWKFKGKEFDVVSCNYSLEQSIDDKGRPASIMTVRPVYITIISNEDIADVVAWGLNSYDRQDSEIVFQKDDADQTMKTMGIKDAYLVGVEETFTSIGTEPRAAFVLKLKISPNTVDLGGINASNKWA